MKLLGVEFETIASNFPEESIKETSTAKLVERLALEKARAVAKDNPEALVIAADTLLSFQGKILGKPKDLDEVRNNLTAVSGKTIEDFTGLAVIYQGKELSNCLVGRAHLRKFGSKEIETYLSVGNPLDKAGGFAGDPAEGGVFLESYVGEPGQELGLATTTLKGFLRDFGLHLP